MMTDQSAGWEAVSDQFVANRSQVGAALVRSWAKDRLPRSAAILDIGCGSGVPIAQALVNDGFSVWGVDASPSLISAFRRNLPDMPAVCEPAQNSSFFDRKFVGVVSIGLIFLLGEDDQRKLIDRVANVLEPGGRFSVQRPTRGLPLERYADGPCVNVAGGGCICCAPYQRWTMVGRLPIRRRREQLLRGGQTHLTRHHRHSRKRTYSGTVPGGSALRAVPNTSFPKPCSRLLFPKIAGQRRRRV